MYCRCRARGPIQQRVVHGAGDFINRRICGRDIQQPGACLGDIPFATRFACNAASAFGLVHGGVADAKASRRVATCGSSVLRFGGDTLVDNEARQVGQAGGDARLAAGALRDAPAHPFRGGLRNGVREARAVMQLATHPIREVAPVAAVEKGADRGGIRAGRVVDCGESNRPSLLRVLAHGAPETPVLVFGGKDRTHLFVSVIGGGNPLRVTNHSRCDAG